MNDEQLLANNPDARALIDAGVPREEVLAEIGRCAGRLYDPRLVPVFLGMDLTEYDRLLARDGAGIATSDPGSDESSTRRAA